MKRGDLNFVWLFAIIAGTAFLILSIYFAVQFGGTFKQRGDAEITKSLQVLTDPLEAGFAAASTGKITFQTNSRVNTYCYDETGFGYHMISVVSESDFLKNENPSPPVEVKVPNKYIFTQEEFGKEFYILSKPFEMGLKISDMLFISTKEYCFVDSPQRIKTELLGLNFKAIRVRDSLNNTCSTETINVCFSDNFAECDMRVYPTCSDSQRCEDEFETGYIQKGSERLHYSGNLLYGAVISEKDQYDCNVDRLLFRTAKVFEVLGNKADLMDARDCPTLLNSPMKNFVSQLNSSSSQDLRNLYLTGKDLDNQERREVCGLW